MGNADRRKSARNRQIYPTRQAWRKGERLGRCPALSHYRRCFHRAPERFVTERRRRLSAPSSSPLLAESYCDRAGCAAILRAVRSGMPPFRRSALQAFADTSRRSFGARAPRLCAPLRRTLVFGSTLMVALPACLYARPNRLERLKNIVNEVSPSAGSTSAASTPASMTVTAGLQPWPLPGGLPLPAAAETTASEATRVTISNLNRIYEPPWGVVGVFLRLPPVDEVLDAELRLAQRNPWNGGRILTAA